MSIQKVNINFEGINNLFLNYKIEDKDYFCEIVNENNTIANSDSLSFVCHLTKFPLIKNQIQVTVNGLIEYDPRVLDLIKEKFIFTGDVYYKIENESVSAYVISETNDIYKAILYDNLYLYENSLTQLEVVNDEMIKNETIESSVLIDSIQINYINDFIDTIKNQGYVKL